jgi:hypothetical protein
MNNRTTSRRGFFGGLATAVLGGSQAAVACDRAAAERGEWVRAETCVDPRPVAFVAASGHRYSREDLDGIRADWAKFRPSLRPHVADAIGLDVLRAAGVNYNPAD